MGEAHLMGVQHKGGHVQSRRRHVHTKCICTPVITPALPQIDMDAKIDKRLYSISIPLVYARISIRSYGGRGQLDRGLMKETSSRRLRGRPKERRVRKIVQRYGCFPWDLIVIIRSPRPRTTGATTQRRV
jgi:hypothetical protein